MNFETVAKAAAEVEQRKAEWLRPERYGPSQHAVMQTVFKWTGIDPSVLTDTVAYPSDDGFSVATLVLQVCKIVDEASRSNQHPEKVMKENSYDLRWINEVRLVPLLITTEKGSKESDFSSLGDAYADISTMREISEDMC